MVAGRRSVSIHDTPAWVFNRMADVYEARPPYPPALIDAIAELAGASGSRIGDVGAGVGHLSLPLAARGFDVVAIEPAAAMLERLRNAARARANSVQAVHAAAEALPLESGSLDVAVVADALHFLDAELCAIELSRVLAPHGALAIVSCRLGDTPFMRGVAEIINSAATRRPRDMSQAIVQLFAVTGVSSAPVMRFFDETPVDDSLEQILRSISFIGPALDPQRFATFYERILALPGPRLWARTFTLYSGRRGRRRVSIAPCGYRNPRPRP
jgi:SAM-dependent methyltransferase